MRRALILPLLVAGAVCAAEGDPVRVKRTALAAVEKSFDVRIRSFDVTDPFELLGATRAVYLEGYGVIFSTEVNLMMTPVVTPFGPTFKKEDVAKIHQKKLDRLPVLKEEMRKMLIDAAAALDSVPLNERIVLAVTIFCLRWEKTEGLPSQIVMQANRQKLLEAQRGKVGPAALDIQAREF